MANGELWALVARLLKLALFFCGCFESTVGQTTPSPRSHQDVANPMVEVGKCGRKDMKSYVCDPDGILSVEQANLIDDVIRGIHSDTLCPCGRPICRPDSYGNGYVVGIAIVHSMRLDHSIRRFQDSPETQERYMEALMNEAKYFAYNLLLAWNMGRCQEDIIIFFSESNNVLYTVTRPEARKKLTDDVVGEIAVNARGHFSHRDTIADGFKEILNNYKLVLMDKRDAPGDADFPDMDLPPPVRGSTAGPRTHQVDARAASLLLLLPFATLSKFYIL